MSDRGHLKVGRKNQQRITGMYCIGHGVVYDFSAFKVVSANSIEEDSSTDIKQLVVKYHKSNNDWISIFGRLFQFLWRLLVRLLMLCELLRLILRCLILPGLLLLWLLLLRPPLW